MNHSQNTGNSSFTQTASNPDWVRKPTPTKPVTVYLMYNEIQEGWTSPNGKDFIVLEKGRLNVPQSIYQMLAFDNPELTIETTGKNKNKIRIPAMQSSKKVRAMHLYRDLIVKISLFNELDVANDTFVITNCEYMDRFMLTQLIKEIYIAEYVIVDWPDANKQATPEQLQQVVTKLTSHIEPVATKAPPKPRAKKAAKKLVIDLDPSIEIDDETAANLANSQ